MVDQLLYFSKSRILGIFIRLLFLRFFPFCPGNKLLRLLFGNFLLNLVVIDGRFYDQCSLPSSTQKWQQFTFFYYVTQAKQTCRKVLYIVYTHRSLSFCSKMIRLLFSDQLQDPSKANMYDTVVFEGDGKNLPYLKMEQTLWPRWNYTN